MGIRVILNQPWYFGERPETQDCKKDDPSCNKIADGDDIFLQFETDPCDSPILCDSDFTAVTGNLVTNGDFEGSASGWTLGATWTYADGKVTSDDTVASNLSQNISGGLNQDECYVLIFTVSDYVAGTLTPILGGISGTSVTANGTYREVIVAGASSSLIFAATGNPNEFSLDNVQVYSLGFCWCPDNGNLYSSSEQPGLLCHIPGAETILTQVGVVPPVVTGRLYRVRITVSDSSAGGVHAIVGAAAVSDETTGNGTFTSYVLADGNNNFEIVMSSDFDGCITDVLVAEMPTQVNVGVVDLDGNLVQDLTFYTSYNDDRINLEVNTSDFSFDYGCYRLYYADPCEVYPEPITSNCFSWRATHPGTKLIRATDTEGDLRFSYDFRWETTTFYLQQRVEANFRRPSRDTKSNTDRFSTGRHFRSYAEKSKRWELVIVGLDETQHDCMDTMWGCRVVEIDEIQYFSDYDEYSPLWDELGVENIADVKIEVTRRDDVIFSDNCNR